MSHLNEHKDSDGIKVDAPSSSSSRQEIHQKDQNQTPERMEQVLGIQISQLQANNKGLEAKINGLEEDLGRANNRIDEQAALFHSMLEYMDNVSFQINSLCHDMQTRVRVIRERNPLTPTQQSIVNLSKQQAQQPQE